MSDLAQRLADAMTKRGGDGCLPWRCSTCGTIRGKAHTSPSCRNLGGYAWRRKPKPDAENAAWLKEWMLANVARAEELVLVIRERFAGDLEYTPDASKEAVEFMLRMTPDQLAACLLEAEAAIEAEKEAGE